MSNKISNVRFEQITSIRKGYNEVRASFVLNGKEGTYFIFTESKNAIKEAKKIFYNDLKAGLVAKSVRRFPNVQHPILISACALLGAAVIALGSVLIYKAVSGQQGLAKKYLINPTKITTYENDKLASEQTITYNDAWYRTGSISKAYNTDTGELEGTTEANYKLDDKNRVLEGEQVSKYASGEIFEKNILKCTFETDNKGTEYAENQRIDDGVVVEISSSYDEYENTYSVEGKRQIDSGEDRHYVNGKLVFKKTRTSDGLIANKGYDAPSKSEGIRYDYDPDTGEITSKDELSSESLISYVDETHTNLRRLNVTKRYMTDDPTPTEEINLMLGSSESNKKGSTIYEEFYNYADREATQLKSGQIIENEYDNLNRPIVSITHTLDVESEDERWYMSNTTSNSYHANENTAYITNNFRYNGEGSAISAAVVYRELDEYGRVTYQETISGYGNISTKSSIKYEYGDPVPLDPSRDEGFYY